MRDEKISLELLGKVLREVRSDQRLLRDTGAEMMRLLLALTDQNRRVERRLNELRDELEPTIKAELVARQRFLGGINDLLSRPG